MTNPSALRSLLFVPGDRPTMIAKLGRFSPDGVVLDLEDAIAPADKNAARETVVRALTTLDMPASTLVLVRVNVPGSPWSAADVAAVAGTRADGVVLPKTETQAQLTELRANLDAHGRPDAVIVIGLETALGVADARQLLKVGADAGAKAAYFGAEDYVADLGGRRTAAGTEVLYARSQVALAARLSAVAALDQAVVAVHDEAMFRADATQARNMGFAGKICLHPSQVSLAHEAFTPTDEEVAHANAVVAAMAGSSGGVVVLGGEMVDDVHVRIARATLARATGDLRQPP